jgi:glyoxylase-like metal-dependent hydrolase (beta-lactamase superfamily II)
MPSMEKCPVGSLLSPLSVPAVPCQTSIATVRPRRLRVAAAHYWTVSATLVQDPESGLCFLLDAGEGTLGQLRRRFTPEGAAEVINSLAFVSISHMHADHHGGLSSVLSQRDQVRRHPLHLYFG